MTGYQKLKTEREILWGILKSEISFRAEELYKDDAELREQYKQKEIAWIEKLIRDETK